MKYGNIIIERKEYDQLKRIISMMPDFKDQNHSKSIAKLIEELKHADIRPWTKMPLDVVRFNSTVTIETPWNDGISYRVVSSAFSDLKNNKISILAPMGLALFGYAEGDEVIWDFPKGRKTIKILSVAQPVNVFKATRR